MIKKYDLGPCACGLLAMFIWGCASPVAPEDPDEGGAGTRGNGSNGGGGSSGSNGGGGGGSRPETPVEELPGVDDTLDVPPDGCLGAASATTLALTLDADVPSVVLAATDGTLQANGVVCTSGGANVAVSALTGISVTGDGAQAGGVIFDLGAGDWSAFLEQPEALRLSFPRGENTFVVRGSTGDDFIRHGKRDSDLIVDLVGDGRINVLASGVTTLGAQLGAGNDKIDDFSAYLTEQQALAAAQAAAEGGAAEPVPEEEAFTYAALSLPLVADGGDGNDWLLGGSVGDQFNGGAGDDVLSGLGGEDTYFTSATDGADVFNGGPEFDAVSYEGRGADLEIHSCAATATIGCVSGECTCFDAMSGEPGENDRLVNVEDITAGSGDDVIFGSEAADSLSGGPGDDEIYGLGGSDLLYGEGGADVMDGGADGDYCAAFGEEEAIACEL